MATECTQMVFGFQRVGRREVVARFDGGRISSDGGALLLGEVARRTGMLAQFAGCFDDHRDEQLVEHSVEQLVSQRVYGLALGYEDLNDHDTLRHDPLLATLVGHDDPLGKQRRRKADRGTRLAGKSTLNRLELTPVGAKASSRYKKIRFNVKAYERLLTDLFIQAHATTSGGPPKRIVLDIDATHDPLHGNQAGTPGRCSTIATTANLTSGGAAVRHLRVARAVRQAAAVEHRRGDRIGGRAEPDHRTDSLQLA
jgi:hypothetical protein